MIIKKDTMQYVLFKYLKWRVLNVINILRFTPDFKPRNFRIGFCDNQEMDPTHFGLDNHFFFPSLSLSKIKSELIFFFKKKSMGLSSSETSCSRFSMIAPIGTNFFSLFFHLALQFFFFFFYCFDSVNQAIYQFL